MNFTRGNIATVDDVTIELNVDGDVAIKDGGITLSKLANSLKAFLFGV